MTAQNSLPPADELVEIVGNRSRGPKNPRGLVFVDPNDANGWAVVVVVPNQRRPKAEIRVYPTGGLARVSGTADAFALQMIKRGLAEVKYADLLPLVRDMLPRAARDVGLMTQPPFKLRVAPRVQVPRTPTAELESADDAIIEPIEEESSTAPYEMQLDDIEPLHERPAVLEPLPASMSKVARTWAEAASELTANVRDRTMMMWSRLVSGEAKPGRTAATLETPMALLVPATVEDPPDLSVPAVRPTAPIGMAPAPKPGRVAPGFVRAEQVRSRPNRIPPGTQHARRSK